MKKEITEEEIYNEKQKRFEKFSLEMEKLTQKYGVELDCTGGVFVMNKEEISKIEEVECSNDYSSGDFSTTVTYKEVV